MKDNRMSWIRSFDYNEKNTDETKIHYTDYEICSESRIVGACDEFLNKNISLNILALKENNDINFHSYRIKIKSTDGGFNFDESNYSKDGYFFNGGIIGEIVAILSIHFRSRFYIRFSNTEYSRHPYKNFEQNLPKNTILDLQKNHFDMFEQSQSNRNFADQELLNFFEKIKKIDQKYHKQIILAFNWYLEAIKEIGKDKEMFYIKMTSCIESLLEFSETKEDSLAKKLNQMINDKIFSKNEEDNIKSFIKTKSISKKFISFFEKYSKGFKFNGRKKIAKHCFINTDNYKEYVKRIYNARSKYLHEGKSMYISSDMNIGKLDRSGENLDNKIKELFWDIDPSFGMFIDKAKISEKDKLPRLMWFEQIVAHCLKNFIDEKSNE